MSSLGNLFHGVFVLAGTATFALPAWEGITRGSPFYTLLFLTLGCLSFVIHCEDTGICLPLKAAVQQRLEEVSGACQVFVFGVMMSVVMEVRKENIARVVAGLWALVSWLQQSPGASPFFPLLVSFGLSFCVLLLDIYLMPRSFHKKYYLRMATILGMAALGALLLVGVSKLWLWDGLWHVYTAVTTYLLLLAQRVKQQQALAAKARGGNAGSGRVGFRSGSTATGSTTKRRGASTGPETPSGTSSDANPV